MNGTLDYRERGNGVLKEQSLTWQQTQFSHLSFGFFFFTSTGLFSRMPGKSNFGTTQLAAKPFVQAFQFPLRNRDEALLRRTL